MGRKTKIIIIMLLVFEMCSLLYIVYKKNAYDAYSKMSNIEHFYGDAFFLGDVNGNNKLDAQDYKYVVRYLLGIMNLNDNQKRAADANGDGKINAVDYKAIVRKILSGNITNEVISKTDTNVPIYSDGTINNNYFNIIKNGNASNGELNSNGINNALIYANKKGIKNIKLEKGNYYVSAVFDYTIGSAAKRKYAIKAKDNVNFDLNGSTITLVSNSLPYYAVLLIQNANNFIVHNGVIKGDRLAHICASDGLLLNNSSNNRCNNDSKVTHEWGHGIHINNSSNITISNLEITESTGDGLSISKVNTIVVSNSNIHYVRRNGISIISGEYITIVNNEIHDIIGTSPQVGIDIEKDNINDVYKNITIDNNKIYNTKNDSINILNKIYNLNISNNVMSSRIYTRVKPRHSLDKADSDEFPTNADDAYLMKKYNITISGNKVINSNIPKEHGEYVIDATSQKINTLNYNGYISLNKTKGGFKETNNEIEYTLKVKEVKTIPITWIPKNPTYKVLSCTSSDSAIAVVTNGCKITAVKEGMAIITATATDYGFNPKDNDDDVIYSFEIKVNVTK